MPCGRGNRCWGLQRAVGGFWSVQSGSLVNPKLGADGGRDAPSQENGSDFSSLVVSQAASPDKQQRGLCWGPPLD